jgi:ComF family protein
VILSNRPQPLAKRLGHLAQEALTLLLPQSCALCGGAAGRWPVCEACAADLPRHQAPRCPRCAEDHIDETECGRCRLTPPAFDACAAALPYAFPTDHLLHEFKYRGRLPLADWFAGWLYAALPEDDAYDLVVPMPLHPARLRERGFNQAAEVARGVARRLGSPLDVDSCQRLRATPPQARLDREARRANLRDAFVCQRDLQGLRVLLVDDVLTTGATADALARALKDQGARRVTAGVIARAPQP